MVKQFWSVEPGSWLPPSSPYFLFPSWYVCMHACGCTGAVADRRSQRAACGSWFSLSTVGDSVSNPDRQGWCQVPLPTERLTDSEVLTFDLDFQILRWHDILCFSGLNIWQSDKLRMMFHCIKGGFELRKWLIRVVWVPDQSCTRTSGSKLRNTVCVCSPGKPQTLDLPPLSKSKDYWCGLPCPVAIYVSTCLLHSLHAVLTEHCNRVV